MDLDVFFAYQRIGSNGPSDCERKEITAALDAENVVVERLYVKETTYPIEVTPEGILIGQIAFGTGNPEPIKMQHTVSSSDGKVHVGFLTEYPRRKYRQYARDRRWFMLVLI